MNCATEIRGGVSVDPLPPFTLGDLLFWIYLYPFQWVARRIPPRVLHAICRFCDPLMQFLARSRRSKMIRWMVASGCAAPADAPKVARWNISRRLEQYVDELVLVRPKAALDCAGIDGQEHYDRARAGQKGVILLTGHFFANRVAAAYLSRKGGPILSVHNQHPPNHSGGRLGRSLMQRFAELRREAYPNVVYIQDPQCGLKILKTLRSGGTVKVQIDGVAGTKWVEAPFLGISRRVPAGIFDLIRISGCAVVPMMTTRSGRSFRIHFAESLPIRPAATREDFISANLPVLLGDIEKWVLQHPEEWALWTHR